MPRPQGVPGSQHTETVPFVRRFAVRDSKQPAGPHVTFTPAAWADFLAHAVQ
ncbi:DUF397 domain-containing protein [Streptomyces sp. NPDC001508]|uniref:DUF397 domain-containing protein n=1 Tax=Streptomyces sp. NPDC001508 TaxID=3154656 RepID=UPI00332F3392